MTVDWEVRGNLLKLRLRDGMKKYGCIITLTDWQSGCSVGGDGNRVTQEFVEQCAANLEKRIADGEDWSIEEHGTYHLAPPGLVYEHIPPINTSYQ